MNIAEYEIVLRVRRRMPIDLEPPPELVTRTENDEACISMDSLDLENEAHREVHEALLAHMHRVVSREDDEHNEIADSLYLIGQSLERRGLGRAWVEHISGITPPVQVMR